MLRVSSTWEDPVDDIMVPCFVYSINLRTTGTTSERYAVRHTRVPVLTANRVAVGILHEEGGSAGAQEFDATRCPGGREPLRARGTSLNQLRSSSGSGGGAFIVDEYGDVQGW
jgi:hypothetical protein